MSEAYYPATTTTGAGTQQHRLKFKSTPLEPLIDALDLTLGEPVGIGITTQDGELALSVTVTPDHDGANVMSIQGDGPERSYLRVTIPEPLAVAIDIDERGLRADEWTHTESEAVIPLGGESERVEVEPTHEAPIYRTGQHEAVQTYLPPAVGEALGVSVGERVGFAVVLANDRPAIAIKPVGEEGSATATIHGTGPNDAQLEVTLPKAVAHGLGIGRDDHEQSLQWSVAGGQAIGTK